MVIQKEKMEHMDAMFTTHDLDPFSVPILNASVS